MATPSPFRKFAEGAQEKRSRVRAFRSDVEERRQVPSTNRPGATQDRVSAPQPQPQRERIAALIRSIRGQ